MGREVVAAVAGAQDLELVAAVDPSYAGSDLATLVPGAPAITVAADLEALEAAGAQVAVDFTAPSVAQANIDWLTSHGIHGVVGTTGLDEAAVAAAVESGSSNLLLAANFAIGAVLLMEFAKQAVRYLPNVEVIELHHDQKVDAPSGTATHTAREIARARREAGHAVPADPTTHEFTPGWARPSPSASTAWTGDPSWTACCSASARWGRPLASRSASTRSSRADGSGGGDPPADR